MSGPDLWEQGCQMVFFQTQTLNRVNLGEFWEMVFFQTLIWVTLGEFWEMLVYFIDIWPILRPIDIFYDHWVYFVVIGFIFSPFWYVAPRKIWQHYSGI
jgi:hypothetical protein